MIVAAYFLMRGVGGGGGMSSKIDNVFKMGRSPAKKVNKELITTTFADVAGCDEVR